VPVVLASGYGHELAQPAMQHFELLRKPYTIEELSRTLHKVVPPSASAPIR
jgi:two-component system NtrC family sensor kinase